MPGTDGNKDCNVCRLTGSSVFFISSAYMILEGVRSGVRSSKLFYGATAFALAGLGSYRLVKIA